MDGRAVVVINNTALDNKNQRNAIAKQFISIIPVLLAVA